MTLPYRTGVRVTAGPEDDPSPFALAPDQALDRIRRRFVPDGQTVEPPRRWILVAKLLPLPFSPERLLRWGNIPGRLPFDATIDPFARWFFAIFMIANIVFELTCLQRPSLALAAIGAAIIVAMIPALLALKPNAPTEDKGNRKRYALAIFCAQAPPVAVPLLAAECLAWILWRRSGRRWYAEAWNRALLTEAYEEERERLQRRIAEARERHDALIRQLRALRDRASMTKHVPGLDDVLALEHGLFALAAQARSELDEASNRAHDVARLLDPNPNEADREARLREYGVDLRTAYDRLRTTLDELDADVGERRPTPDAAADTPDEEDTLAALGRMAARARPVD